MDDLEQPVTQDSAEVVEPAEHDETQQELDADSPDLDTPEEDDEEVEVGGRKFALPKSAAETLAKERLMQADYTRKTQEVAETRKQIEARAAQVESQAREHQQYIGEIAKVQSIDERLTQFAQLDWDAAIDNDPVQAMKWQQEHRALQLARDQAVSAITQKQQQFALNEQQVTAKQVQDASAYFQREIPGWTAERDNQVAKFAVDEGIPAQALAAVILKHPQFAKIIHKAELYAQMEKKQTAKPKTPTPPPAPVTRVSSSRATAAKDPDKLSPEEWQKQFYADRSKRR
ncbi:Adenylyl cyclase [Janthinobacterium sp. CG23_2]|nr:Adenylyl cyclase [Janthinobacterium sp. CG23_2]CUU27669.1 Adenylyl cyclase [Janthinobacterium sp. CG23_2]